MTATPTSVTQPRARTPVRLLTDRAVGPFIAGKILSACGHWIEQLAAAVLMYQLTRSALLVGAVTAAQFGPQLVLALWAGALADRADRRKLLMIARLISGGACLALGALVLMNGVDGFGGEPVLLGAVAIIGIGHAIGAPPLQALIHDLVPRRDLEAVLALNSASPSLARTVGPAVGAGLLLLGGPGLAFVATGGAHFAFLLVLALIRARTYDGPKGRPSLLGGVHYLARDRSTALLLLGVVLIGFGSDPVLTLTPKLADSLGHEHLVGTLVFAFGLGAVVLALVFSTLRRVLTLRVATLAGYLVLAVGLGMAGLLPVAWGAITGFLVAGFGFMLTMVAINTRIQQKVPDHVRGRVMALWSIAFLGPRPLIAPANGAIADSTSAAIALCVAAAVVACASLLALVKEKHGE